MILQDFVQNLMLWFFSHGVKIVLILLAAFLANRFLGIFFEKAIKKQVKNKISAREKRKRVETLMSVFKGTVSFVVWILIVLMILPEFGINIAPILAGIGVAGLAVGMAAKDIVSDFIAGLFIILEDQYHVGDKVKIAGIEGEVVEISLRKTMLKDSEGTLHLIPNNQIKIVAKELKEE